MRTNAPAISWTENQNWAVSPAGIQAGGTSGSSYGPGGRLNSASMAAPRTSGGSRLAPLATRLATMPTPNHSSRGRP